MSTNSVLIVDDNTVDAMLVSKMIRRSGCFGTVHTASNGAEALAMYQDHQAGKTIPDFPPRLVLLDINMPLMDGFGFLEHFAQLPQPETPHDIVLLTSSNAPSDRDRAEKNPLVLKFQVKPFRVKDAAELAEHFDLSKPDDNAAA